MGFRYGGETPVDDFGLRITVEAPDSAAIATPVNVGDLFKLGGTADDGSGYKAVPLVAGDDPTEVVMLQAAHRIVTVGPLTCFVISRYDQIRRIPYKTGSAPSIGQSIEASTDLITAVGIGYKSGGGYVCYVDTVSLDAEVLC